MTRTCLGLAFALACSSPCLAQPYADLALVDAAVARFSGAAMGEEGGAAMPVDRRLRLAPCNAALTLEWFGLRRDTVLVRCPSANGWTLYVPLRRTAPLAQAEQAVARGDAVSVAISGAGFSVSQNAEAVEGGAVGAWIKVRLSNPRAPLLRARVVRPGLVGIELP